MDLQGRLRWCLNCGCLGDELFGQDVDAIFAYQTPKIVVIQDRTLGVTRILLLACIFSYIVMYQIWYKGGHFQVDQVAGIARLQWQEPTANGCNPLNVECKANFTSMEKLPYCSQYTGPLEVAPAMQRACAFKDAWELPLTTPQGVLVPTLIETFGQARACDSYATACERQYAFQAVGRPGLQEGTGKAKPASRVFVADVEDITLLIDHSFRTTRGILAYDDFSMKGYWEACNVGRTACSTKPISCVHSRCKEQGLTSPGGSQKEAAEAAPLLLLGRRLRSRGLGARGGRASVVELEAAQEAASEAEEPKVISINDGDVLSIKTMLAMAGRSLDDVVTGRSLDPGSGALRGPLRVGYNETRRMRGGALVIRIFYDNAGHWRLLFPMDPPKYTISVTVRPLNEFKHVYVSKQTEEGRELIKAYGLLIIVEQEGRICHFDVMHALIVLTAALGLLAVSNTLTDFLAMVVMPKRQIYTELKYQESEDLVTIGGGSVGKENK